MDNDLLITDHPPSITKHFIFHDSLSKVYSSYCNLTLHSNIYLPAISVVKYKRNTSLDDEENEITYSFESHTFTCRIEKVITSTTFNSITVKCINCPPQFSSFTFIHKFFWDTNHQVCIYQALLYQDDPSQAIMSFFQDSSLASQKIEAYIATQTADLIETQSITIANTIEYVWEYIKDVRNLKDFFPKQNIEVAKDDDDVIVIKNSLMKSELKLRRSEVEEFDGNRRELRLELFYSSMPSPKQLITIELIYLEKVNTFMLFKTKSLEYIRYDVLNDNSLEKKKILRNLKKKLDHIPEKKKEP